MKLTHRLLKIVAVVSSALLVGLYIYDQAGGTLLKNLYRGAPAESSPALLPGSKSKTLGLAVDSSKPPALMPGRKSSPVFSLPQSPDLQSDQPMPAQTSQTSTPQVLSSGSKSKVPLIPVPQNTTNAPAPAEQNVLPRTLIHGSKSFSPVIPPPGTTNAAPPAPNQPQ